MIKEVILLKIGEIILKGLNRRTFEDTLIKNIKYTISPCGEFQIINLQSIIYLIPKNSEVDIDSALEKARKIFGIAAISKAYQVKKDLDVVLRSTCEYLNESLSSVSTFKVEAKRSDKSFQYKSPEICVELGEHILERFPNLKVDVHKPDVTVNVEIRDLAAYIYTESIKGAGGIPIGTGGKAAVLISGGIDSPVAAWMMAKRGMQLTAIHFASPPYTSPRAEKKVVNLLEKVSLYSGKIDLITVPFTEIQEKIHSTCQEDLFTIIMRRTMFKISNAIADIRGCNALITGESLGQVASQTIGAICCVNECCKIPVFRPLIGMDKKEIINISRKIDAFNISIQPFEDCCTIFTPKHPRTRPILASVIKEEQKIDFSPLIKRAINNIKIINIKP